MRVWLAAVPVLVAVLVAGVTVTAANTVAPVEADEEQRAQDADDLKPAACAGITVTAVLTAPNLSGGGGNELILGSGSGETISGGGGDDCIMGGGGNDTIDGGFGNDVVVGGPGTDTCLNTASDDCEI